MRFIVVLFFVFLSLHSYLVFAQVSTAPTPPEPTCKNIGSKQCRTTLESSINACHANNAISTVTWHWVNTDSSGCGSGLVAGRCDSNCSCPPPYVFNLSTDANGLTKTSCIDPANEGGSSSSASSCPSGYPAYNGSCAVCPGGYNSDGSCSSGEGGSSANNSSDSKSSAASSVANSSGGGDDDGGNDGGSGGGGNNNGGSNNGGGGSASSAASASSKAATSASSAGSSGAGQCDPTAKNYLACIGSQKLDGGETAWVPNSGYGNWLPVNENSPCVNKYQDASGQWWCAAPSNNGSGTGSSSGTGTSSGSGSSAAGQCDSTSKDYLQCISSGNGSSSGANSSSTSSSSANASSSGTFSSLGEKGEFDGEASEKKHDELVEELEQKIEDIKADIAGQFGGEVTGSGTIQDFCKNIRGNEVCFGMKKFEEYLEPISAAIFLVACVISFAIVLRG